MKILISAAEASSDIHGAALLKALQEQGDEIQAFGIGGPKLQAQGLETVVDARELLVMGFAEILGHLPKIFRALKKITQVAEERKPDIAIVIDYPDFHFRLAKRLKKMGVPTIYYIPPKVWVWRKGRIRFLKKYFVKILSILPFEIDFYKKQNIPLRYVGNPLMDTLPLQLSREEARKTLHIPSDAPVLVVMPGSRKAELKYHLNLMIQAVGEAAQTLGKKWVVLMPFPLTVDFEQIQQKIAENSHPFLDIRASQGNAATCMVAADAGLIKSGTSTLEAAILQCPHSIVFKTHPTTEWIFKNIIRYRGPVGLTNLVAGWKPGQEFLVREILCDQVTLESLKQETMSLMTDSAKREKITTNLRALKETLLQGTAGLSPSACAAQEVIQWVKGAK